MKKGNIMIIVSILAFIAIILGISYSYFVYNKDIGVVTLNTGDISIDLSGISGNKTLTNVLPLSDRDGMSSSDYFDFTVNSTVDTEKIYYEVYILPDNANTLDTSYLKVYLTDQSNVKISEVVSYDSLIVSEKSGGKVIYKGLVELNNNHTSKNETKDFRLRMWLDENYTEPTSKAFSFDIYLYAKNVSEDYSISVLKSTIVANVSQSYVSSYKSITDQQAYSSFTTQDTVGENANKEIVYYYTGADAAANANVLFAGFCWQIVRTTDNGGIRMIYNGIAQKPVTASTPISSSDVTVTNDGTYEYTYDSTTKKWTSANAGVASTTDTFIFKANTAGDYAINYKVSSEATNDKASIYIKPYGGSYVLQAEYSGEMEGTFDLGTLSINDEIKIEYSKNDSTNSGDDNITFDIATVSTRAENPACAFDRRTTGVKAINANGNGTTKTMGSEGVYGRSFDYNLTAGYFTLQDTSDLPTSWNGTDANNVPNYTKLIGTYTCLNGNATTCSSLYYVGSINASNTAQAYVVKYEIGNVAHYSQMGTSAFNSKHRNPAMVGYMFNKEYEYTNASPTGTYHTNAVWNPSSSQYDLSSDGDSSTTPNATHRYMCDDNDCTKVRYYYYQGYYVVLENGDAVEDALYKMTGNGSSGTLTKNDGYILNKYNSAMKGYLDNWYKKNLTDYSGYLDNNAVYCNDRSLSHSGGWNPSNTEFTGWNAYIRFKQYSVNRNLDCMNVTDRFSVANSEAKLVYPIGLLTEPERNLMTANFANTGQNYWGSSPYAFDYYNARIRSVTNSGESAYNILYLSYGARGVVTLKPGIEYTNGSGTYLDPYIVGPIVTRTN